MTLPAWTQDFSSTGPTGEAGAGVPGYPAWTDPSNSLYDPPTVGVPAGGTTGQALIKHSNNNYDTEWGDHDDLAGVHQDVNTTATPTFNQITISTPPVNDTDAATKKFVEDAVEGENLWDRSGATLIPHTVGDGVAVDKLTLNTTYTPTGLEPAGTNYWDQTEHTYTDILEDGVKGQRYKEDFSDGQNDTGALIADGTPVDYAGSIGNSGNFRIEPSLVTATKPSFYFIGLATQNIANGDVGRITTRGKVRGIQTDGANYGEVWVAGDIVYPSCVTPGYLTKVPPEAPCPAIPAALVISAHSSNGTLFVRPSYPQRLTELVDVDGTPLTTTGQIPLWDNDNQYFDFNYNPLSIHAITKEPTGFVNNSDCIVSYDSTTRKITLTGTVEAYWRGERITALTSGWVSDAHDATTGSWFLSYDGTNFNWSQTVWTFDKVQIAYIYYGASDKFAIKETHGVMPWQSHEEDHDQIGTYKKSGGTLGSYVLNSTTAGDRRPTISACTIKDEDIVHVLNEVTNDTYTIHSLSGAGASSVFTVDTSDIVLLSGSNPYYNQFTGGAWQQTLLGVSNYMAMWLVAVPAAADTASQKYRFLWIQGQTASLNQSTIEALTPSSLTLGGFTSIFPEYVFVAKVVLQYVGGNWQLKSVSNITGNRASTVVSGGGFLTSVSVNPTNLSGDGTASNPVNTIQDIATTSSPSFAGLTVDTNTLYVDSVNNRVGIGTTSPDVVLSITGATSASANIVINAPTSGQDSNILLREAGNNKFLIGNDASDNLLRFYDYSAASTVMAILEGGNIGIGTTSPSSKLSINGGLHVGGDSDAGDNNLLVDGDTTISGLTASQILSTDVNKKLTSLDTATYPSLTELSYVKGVTSALQGQIDGKLAATRGNWKVFYSDGSGVFSELSLGASGTVLTSNGASSVPSFTAPAGGGDVLGPATNTDNYIPQWDGANSKTLKNGINPTTLPVISSGSGAPSSTPGKVGDKYYDTTNFISYTAYGASSSADWKDDNNGKIVLGQTISYNNTALNTANYITAARWTANFTGYIRYILMPIYTCTTGGKVTAGVYSSVSNAPNTKLGQTSEYTLNSTNDNDHIIRMTMTTPVLVTAGTDYWISTAVGTSNLNSWHAEGTARVTQGCYYALTYNSTLPATFGSSLTAWSRAAYLGIS